MGAARVGSAGNATNVSVGTSAVLIAAARQSRKSIRIRNAHATQTLDVGVSSSVTTSNGYRVAAGLEIVIDDYPGALYGIASGAATDVRVLEVYG